MLFQTLGHAPWRNEEREHEYELTNIEKASRITVVNNTIELNPCAVAVVVMKKRDGGKLVGRVGSVRGGGA